VKVGLLDEDYALTTLGIAVAARLADRG